MFRRPVRLGTDCSGMGTAALALRGLSIPFDYVFGSEICPVARAAMQANTPCRTLFHDIHGRQMPAETNVDIYVAGFPCQSFSVAGLRAGFSIDDGRGLVFFEVVRYIREFRPKAFLLENVEGLLTLAGGECFWIVWSALTDLKHYNVHFQRMNTRDHGIPQNRPRVFFVGLRRDVDRGTFSFPEPFMTTPSVEEFLDPRMSRPSFLDLPGRSATVARFNVFDLLQKIGDRGHDPFFEPWILDCDSSIGRAKSMQDMCPCLTRSRGKGYWLSNRGRRMNVSEMLRLQGWQGSWTMTSSPLQLGQMIGNAMSINVLQRLFCRILPSIGLVDLVDLPDPWTISVSRLGRP